MPFTLYNTLTRRQEEFIPLRPPHVGLYTCGPTVYNFAHIGNFRAYIFEDLLRRHLRYLGYAVNQVMNLTDVDDKTIKGSIEKKVTLNDYTRPYKEAFFQDLKTLNIEPAEHYPAATDHIPEMIALIQALIDKGYAYRSDDGSAYFSIAQFPAYGRLAHLDMAGLKPGARIAQDEYQKENVADFALWKAWTPEDGEVAWDSPWGRGRPGWHIECSAMSMKYLGPTFDLHTGGVDNIFPHHDDEIAQSEAATGQPFVTYWMHCGHLGVDGKKMSKSLGNCHTLSDLQKRGHSAREIRYVLMSAQYRQALNFTFEGLAAARSALARLDAFVDRLREITQHVAGSPQVEPEWVVQARMAFVKAMNDDLNTPLALAALFDLIHEGNRRADTQRLPATEAWAALRQLEDMDRIFGLLKRETDAIPPEITQLAQDRLTARKTKAWAEADRLRKLLTDKGWAMQDTADGFKLKKIQ